MPPASGRTSNTRRSLLLVGLVLLAIASATASTQTVPTSIWRPRFPVTTPVPTPPPIVPPPIPAPPQPSGKPVLQASDFTYLGALRMPESGADTTYAYGGLTGRVVNGRLHLLLYGSNIGTPKDTVYEIEDPGSGYNVNYTQAPRATFVRGWGDIYHGKRTSWAPDGTPIDLQYLIPDGLYWNDSTQLLYWTYFDSYNVSGRPDWGLGATRLDDPDTGQSTAFGPWRATVRDADGHTFYGPWRCRYLFASPFDGSMMCGSSLASGVSGSPWGPDAFGGRPWPTTSTPGGYGNPDLSLPTRYLEYYYMGNPSSGNYVDQDGVVHGKLRAFRRTTELPVWETFTTGQIVRANPARNGGKGSWSELDNTAGAVWLELPNKHGVIFSSTLVGSSVQDPTDCTNAAHEWYSSAGGPTKGLCSHGCAPPVAITGPVTTAAFPAFIVYDPDVLTQVANGTVADYSVEPSSVINLERTYGIKTAPIVAVGGAKGIRGAYFDATRKYLFIVAPLSDNSRSGPDYNEALIHVFAVKD